jgi:S-DNA-T family DNA segregation ATPase FtsK/SpoIIIE
VAAQLYDFSTGQRLAATPNHPVVEGQVKSTTPNLPVHVPGKGRTTRSTRPVRLPAVRVNPKVSAAAGRWTGKTARFVFIDFPFATLRGLFLAIAAWWHWVHQSTRRREAGLDGRYASQAKDIAEKSTARFKQSAITLGVGLLLVLMFWRSIADRAYLLTALVVLVLFCRGYDWKARRRGVDQRASIIFGGVFGAVGAALRSAGLMKEDQDIRVVEHPITEGRGQRGVVLLPMGLSVTKVIKARAAFSSGLSCDSDFLVLWKAGSDDKLGFWIPTGDPFANNARRLPLLDENRWNVWRPAPFGFTARDQNVDLSLIGSNMLLSSKPNGGKTYAARCVVAPFILDPTVKVYVANGKGDGAWSPTKDFATRYIRGATPERAIDLDRLLTEVQEEMTRRMEDVLVEASKLTETMGEAPILVVIDELQAYTVCGEPHPDKLRGQRATYGQWICQRLIDLAQRGRAAGVILVLITQKPSDESLPSQLRDQLGTRWAGKVMTYHVSNMILGGNASVVGADASKISSQHKGLGIFVPDMEEGVLDESLGAYPKVRTYLCEDVDWAVLCAKGWALREQEGTLPSIPDVFEDPTDDLAAVADVVTEPVPELLARVCDYVADMDDHERVSTLKIRADFAPELSVKKIGGMFRGWGAASGRDRGGDASGPLVSDVRRAVERIEGGGPVTLFENLS